MGLPVILHSEPQASLNSRHTMASHAWRALELKMDTLAATLDEELHALAHGDEHLLSESIEVP